MIAHARVCAAGIYACSVHSVRFDAHIRHKTCTPVTDVIFSVNIHQYCVKALRDVWVGLCEEFEGVVLVYVKPRVVCGQSKISGFSDSCPMSGSRHSQSCKAVQHVQRDAV